MGLKLAAHNDSYSKSKGKLGDGVSVMDSIPLNVLGCDPKTFKIDYANRASVEALNNLADLLPEGVSGDNIVGQTIDIFHKKPEYQRNMLADPSNFPHNAVIRLGPELLDLHVDAVIAPNGTIKRLILSWAICTERERLKEMVDNMPINVMMADPESFVVNFANKTSVDTLRTIEHLLPIKAEELVGTCIDDFHKKPEHQRRILSDPKNLPYNSKIKVGDEVLDLNVSAIVDRTGYYIGPMVSWSVITQQERLAKNVAEISSSVSSMSEELQQTAQSLSSAAEESSVQATSAAAASEQATNNVQTVASAAEEMSVSIAEIAEEITRSNEVARHAMETAEKTNQTVEDLHTAANQIGSVIGMINDIAEQTNLLALNATIEAARAGDAGKGFAVVASEVKDLAGQTARATEQIQEQISSMQVITTQAVESISMIHKTINQINETSTAISSAIEEQAATTKEIARNVTDAAQGTSEVSKSVDNVQQAAQQTGAAATQLLDLAGSLADNSSTMNTEVNAFLNKDQ